MVAEKLRVPIETEECARAHQDGFCAVSAVGLPVEQGGHIVATCKFGLQTGFLRVIGS